MLNQKMAIKNDFSMVLLLLLFSAGMGTVAWSENEELILENPYLKAKIAATGGKMSYLGNKLSGYTITIPKEDVWTGLCKERFKENDALELFSQKYLLAMGQNGSSVKATLTSPQGFTIVKEYTLPPDKIYVRVDLNIQNNRDGILSVTPWIHNYLPSIRKRLRNNYVFTQQANEILQIPLLPSTAMDNYISSPVAPWIGAVDQEAKQGIVIYIAKGNLDKYYISAERTLTTLEWIYQKVDIAAHETWRTTYYLIPISGITSPAACCKDVVVSEENGRLILYPTAPFGASTVKLKTSKKTDRQTMNLNPGQPVTSELTISGISPFEIKIDPQGTNEPIILSFTGEGRRELRPLPEKTAATAPVSKFPCPNQVNHNPPPDAVCYYFSDYYEHVCYISPDSPSMISLGQASTLTRRNEDPDLQLIFEVPEGIKIENAKWLDTIETEPIKRNGAAYTRYKLKFPTVPWINPYYTCTEYPANWLLWSTTLKAGQEVKGYYYAKWKGGQQPEESLPIKVISIGKAAPAKKLYINFSQHLPSLLNLWPTFEWIKNLGFNCVALEMGRAYTDHYTHFPVQKPDSIGFKEALIKARKSGLPVTGTTPFFEFRKEYLKGGCYYKAIGTLYHPTEHFTEWDPAEAMPVNIKGERLPAMMCPSYRGQYFEKGVDYGKSLVDNGIYLHDFDMEWPNYSGGGQNICFCNRCIAGFKNFLPQEYPDLPLLDPKLFEQEPEKYQAHHLAWVDYKTYLYANIFRDYKNAIQAYLDEKGVREKIRLRSYVSPGFSKYDPDCTNDIRKLTFIQQGLENPGRLGKFIDYYEPSFYVDLVAAYSGYFDMLFFEKEVGGFNKFLPKESLLCPILSAGYPFPYWANNIPGNGMMKWQILETIISGAKGFVMYAICPYDALDMKYTVEAMKQILPVEDIILAGKPTDKVKSADGKVFAKGIESGKGAVVGVSEYSMQPKESIIEYKVGKESEVVNLETGETVAVLTPEKNSFKVKLDKERIVLFFIGDKQALEK